MGIFQIIINSILNNLLNYYIMINVYRIQYPVHETRE